MTDKVVEEIEAPLPKKKKRRRPRRKTTGQRKPYFGTEVHDAIVVYQGLEDLKEREKIYITTIVPALEKLVENLIFVYGFKKGADSYENLKNDCVEFLYQTLDKFDATRGTKAFSYFNVVAKNWLIITSKKRLKNLKRHVNIDDASSFSRRESESFDLFNRVDSPDVMSIKRELVTSISKMLNEIKGNLVNENERLCIESIIRLFDNIDDLDLLNKRAVFLYIREMSGLTPKQLTVAMSAIKKHYRGLRDDEKFGLF